jgi:hypothetical protein
MVSDSGLTSLDYLLIGAKVIDLVWDPPHSRLLAVTAADSAIAPSSLLAVDPMTGITQTVPNSISHCLRRNTSRWDIYWECVQPVRTGREARKTA